LISLLYFLAYARRARILLNAMLKIGQIDPLIKAKNAPRNKNRLCLDPNLKSFPKTFYWSSLGGSFSLFYPSCWLYLISAVPS
jgi:hypothetical protein